MFLRVYRVKEEKQTLQLDYNQVRNQLEQSLKNYEILQSQQLIIQKAEYLPGTDVKNQTRSQHHQKLLLVDSKLRRQILILRLIREIRIIKEIRKLSTIKSFEIKGLQKDLEFEQNRRNFKKKRMKQIYNYFSKEKIKQLEQQLQEVNTKNQELNREKVILETKINIDTQNVERLNELFQQNLQLEKRIADYKVQVGSSNDQIKKLQSTSQIEIRGQIINGQDLVSAERIQNYEIKIIKLNAELVNFQQLLNENQKQLSDVKEKCHQNYQKIMELEKNVEDLTYLLKEKERLIKEREQNINQISIKYQESKRVQIIYQHIKKYKEIAQQVDPKKVLEIDSEIFKVEERLSALEEQRNQEQIREEEQRQKELDVRQKKLKQEQQQYSDLLQKSKVQKYKTIQCNQNNQHQFQKCKCQKVMVQLRSVCFQIDVTQSMDPYKQQVMQCIKESLKTIKIKTNRDCLWATIGYQDFEELNELEIAEDLRGAIIQMVKNLLQSKTFRIAILICDAPTHGKKYNGVVSDNHPDEDIEDAIKLLIESKIILVATLFSQITLLMFQEIKKMYQNADQEELLMFADLENTQQGKIWEELVDLISSASQKASQTNNTGTKSKNIQINKRSQAGAMQALCNQIKDPFQFYKLPEVKTIPIKFQVYSVELQQDSFENNIENLKFAQGQLKQVFLMKRQNNHDELYVIKMPIGNNTYTSQEQTIFERRSYLISKCLMKKFIRELREARDKIDMFIKIPEVQYSDFLILKDIEKKNSFWIAERYFTGEFVRYNNNYGYINDNNSDINHLAQAFTYYTYIISNFNYMVNDVQGVGNYITDPALNTKENNFDETDMGIDGQAMFIVNYVGETYWKKILRFA